MNESLEIELRGPLRQGEEKIILGLKGVKEIAINEQLVIFLEISLLIFASNIINQTNISNLLRKIKSMVCKPHMMKLALKYVTPMQRAS